jgi:hypothetical protein
MRRNEREVLVLYRKRALIEGHLNSHLRERRFWPAKSGLLSVSAAAVITSQRYILRGSVVDLSLSRLDPRLGAA